MRALNPKPETLCRPAHRTMNLFFCNLCPTAIPKPCFRPKPRGRLHSLNPKPLGVRGFKAEDFKTSALPTQPKPHEQPYPGQHEKHRKVTIMTRHPKLKNPKLTPAKQETLNPITPFCGTYPVACPNCEESPLEYGEPDSEGSGGVPAWPGFRV